jgi:Subtilase family
MTSVPPEQQPDGPDARRFGFDLPPDVAMSPAGDYLFRAGQLLVPLGDLERIPELRDFLLERGRLRVRGPGRVRVAVIELNDVDLGDLARDRSGRAAVQTLELLDEIERRWPESGVELNYVVVGSQTVMGGPASVAEPAELPHPPWPDVPVGSGLVVGVLDTGIIGADVGTAAHTLLSGRFFVSAGAADEDIPAEASSATWLDRQGGHGTFVAGVVRKIAPGARIAVGRVLKASGEADVIEVAEGIARLSDAAEAADVKIDVLNLSLGCHTRRDRPSGTLAAALAPLLRDGTVVVAAAGNTGSWRPFYPAALPGVVGVGALAGNGPAPFSNYGPWVDACAPGVDVVSTFFDESGGALPQVELAPPPWSSTPIPARFPGFARWSGTSFAAPAVAGAIVAAAWAWQVTAAAAAAQLLRDWHRYRVPDLGVVVNAC